MNYELEQAKYEKAKKNGRWKGSPASYESKHQFLVRNFGNPVKCEFCDVEGKYEGGGRWSIQWAKKQGVSYSHLRTDYFGLCRSCHRQYDMTPKELERLRTLARHQTPSQLLKLSSKRKVIAKTAFRINGRFAKTTT